MARYHLRVALDVTATHETTLREDHHLDAEDPLLDVVRGEVWEALTAIGAETGRWDGVQVT